MMHLSTMIDGFGAHPAAWRSPGVTPGDLFDPMRAVALARLAEEGLLDFVTLDDQRVESPQPGTTFGALDAPLVLALAAAHTHRIGLVPTGVTRGDPVAMAARIATLDRVSGGRGGWRPRVFLTDEERRNATADPEAYADFTDQRFQHVTEYVDAVIRFWDSWADDAVAADGTAPEFVDPQRMRPAHMCGEQVHATGFGGIPTSADGQPLLVTLAHFTAPFKLAARHADIVCITPFTLDEILAVRAELAQWCVDLHRGRTPLTVLADLNVVLGPTEAAARERLAFLDARFGSTFSSDAATFVGTPEGLADFMEHWHTDGGVDGFRLRPAVLPDDLSTVVTELVPLLQRRGLYKTSYPDTPLRFRLRTAAHVG
ncbi:monooxygenase [Kutzneria sp. 744]|nr:monooxygenase [Kutzneria sp. 744]